MPMHLHTSTSLKFVTCVFPLYVQSGLQHAQSTICSVLFKVVYTHSGCKVGLRALVEV